MHAIFVQIPKTVIIYSILRDQRTIIWSGYNYHSYLNLYTIASNILESQNCTYKHFIIW